LPRASTSLSDSSSSSVEDDSSIIMPPYLSDEKKIPSIFISFSKYSESSMGLSTTPSDNTYMFIRPDFLFSK